MKKNQQNKKYNKYVKDISPKPKYLANSIKAFVTGGLVCVFGYAIQQLIISRGIDKENAGTIVIILLVCLSQLLTGFGVYDKLAKYAGAGLIVPITGFANSVVAPAMEYKREGVILGVGAKLFSLAGPVLVCGYSAAVVIGIIYTLIY